MLKVEEDIDIGDEIPMINYPPIEIERDAPSPTSNVRSSNSSSSSSASDSSSGKELNFLRYAVQLCSLLYFKEGVCNMYIIFVCVEADSDSSSASESEESGQSQEAT